MAGTGKTVQTVILASVVVFEMVGPLLTRAALVNAGEVTILHLLEQRSPVGYGEGLRRVLGEFLRTLVLSPILGRRLPEDIRVAHIMRRNVEVLPHKEPFDEVVKTLGNSRYDGIPVVNEHDELVGVVKYADVADTLFEPALRHLVVAAEIATDAYLWVTPENTLKTAMLALRRHPRATFLLVATQDAPSKLVGIVSHNDLLSTHLRQSHYELPRLHALAYIDAAPARQSNEHDSASSSTPRSGHHADHTSATSAPDRPDNLRR